MIIKMKIVSQWIQDLPDIEVSNTDNPISTLSGGNQQKVVLAKWILTQPRVLILDAPTVGVDIAAKSSICRLIVNFPNKVFSILLISDEIPEVYYNCDRILHIEHGQIMNEYEPERYRSSFLEEVVNAILKKRMPIEFLSRRCNTSHGFYFLLVTNQFFYVIFLI